LFLVLGMSLLASGAMPLTFAATHYATAVSPGNIWNLTAIVECSIYCPFRSIENVSGILLSVKDASSGLATLNETYTFRNETQPRVAVLQGDLNSGSGNLSSVLIAGALGAGDSIYNIATTDSQTFNPSINATVAQMYYGALREVNVVTLPHGPGDITETLIWDQISGAVVEVDLSDPAYGTGDSVSIKLASTNMWSQSTAKDLAVDSNPLSQELVPGHQTSFLLIVTGFGGLAGSISLSLTHPSEIGAYLNTTAITLNSDETAYTTLTVAAPSNLAPALYVLNVTAQSGLTVRYAAVTVFIEPPDFLLFASPTFFPAGQVGSAVILVVSLNDFNGTIGLSLADPIGLTGSCDPTLVSVNTTDSLSAADCTFSSSTPGSYTASITGNNGQLSHSQTLYVTVTPTPTTPDFYMNVNPNFLDIAQGSSANTTVTLTALNGFKGYITLTGVGELGLFETFTPRTVNLQSASATAVMSVQVRPGLQTSIPYDIKIIGANGTGFSALVHTAIVDAIVNRPPQPDFAITGDQLSISFDSSQSGMIGFNIAGQNGFASDVTLTTNISPSEGLSLDCSARISVTNSPTLGTCSLHSSTPGLYQVTLIATGGGSSHSATITVTIGDFSLTSSSSFFSANAGSRGTSTITIEPLYGFTEKVDLTVSTPLGVSCSLSQTTIIGSGTTTLTCNSDTPGTYKVTVYAPAYRKTIEETFTVNSQRQPASTLLGLQPELFYAIVGSMIGFTIALIAIAVVLKHRH